MCTINQEWKMQMSNKLLKLVIATFFKMGKNDIKRKTFLNIEGIEWRCNVSI